MLFVSQKQFELLNGHFQVNFVNQLRLLLALEIWDWSLIRTGDVDNVWRNFAENLKQLLDCRILS